MQVFEVPMTHRPERDGTYMTGTHAPFYLPLEMAMTAWMSTLVAAGSTVLQPRHLAVAHVSADLGREMHTEATRFEVSVERIGNSSLTLSIGLHQRGRQTGTVHFVLVRVTDDRARSVAFTGEERALLEHIQTA